MTLKPYCCLVTQNILSAKLPIQTKCAVDLASFKLNVTLNEIEIIVYYQINYFIRKFILHNNF